MISYVITKKYNIDYIYNNFISEAIIRESAEIALSMLNDITDDAKKRNFIRKTDAFTKINTLL